MLSFWASMHDVKLRHTKLSWQYYEHSANAGYNTWPTHVLKLLDTYGLNSYRDQLTVCKVSFNRVMKRAVKSRAHSDLSEFLLTLSRGELFRALHVDTKRGERAWYLDQLEQKNVRALSRFRMHNHRLASEVGAWTSVGRAERVCLTCGSYEDEVHVMMTCVRYEQFRKRYLRRTTRPPREANFADTVALLNSRDLKTVNNVCVFLRKSMPLHSEYIVAINAAVSNSQS